MGKVAITNLVELVNSIKTISKDVLLIPQFDITPDEIINHCDINNSNRYNKLQIPKKHKKGFRTVYAPQGKLSIILKALNEILNSLYIPDKYVSGFIRKRSIADNAYNHIGQQYVLSIDLRDFFEHIKYDRIVQKLTEKPYSFPTEIARVIAQLTCIVNPKDNSICLAQGSPIAPIISNIVFENIDRSIYNYCCSNFVRYSRYADDLTFSCNQDILHNKGTFMNAISTLLLNEHFPINKKKTRLRNRSQRQEVTGIVVNVKPNVPRSFIKDIRNLLYIWEKHGIKDVYKSFFFHHNKQWQNQKKDVPYVVNYLRGKISYLGLIRGYSDNTYIKFTQKFNYLLTKTTYVGFQIRFRDFNSKLLQSGINLSSFTSRLDQFGQSQSFLNAGWYGKVYFHSNIFKKLINTDYHLAHEYFSKVLATNIAFSRRGVYLYATEKSKHSPLSPELSSLIPKKPERIKDKSWKITSYRHLTTNEIDSIAHIVIEPSEYGMSAKFEYKNGAIKFIPMDTHSIACVGEVLEPERVIVLTLHSNDTKIKPIQRIRHY